MAEGFPGSDGADLSIQLCSSPMGRGLTLLPNPQTPHQLGPNHSPGMRLGTRGGRHGKASGSCCPSQAVRHPGKMQRKQVSGGVGEGEPSQGAAGSTGVPLARRGPGHTGLPDLLPSLALPPSLGTILACVCPSLSHWRQALLGAGCRGDSGGSLPLALASTAPA